MREVLLLSHCTGMKLSVERLSDLSKSHSYLVGFSATKSSFVFHVPDPYWMCQALCYAMGMQPGRTSHSYYFLSKRQGLFSEFTGLPYIC